MLEVLNLLLDLIILPFSLSDNLLVIIPFSCLISCLLFGVVSSFLRGDFKK